MRQQASGIRGSAGPSRTLSQRAIDRVRRVLAARRQHTENAELAAAIKFTQEGKRRSTPLRTEARLDRRVPGALWQVLCRDWFEFCYHQSSLEDACGCSGSSHCEKCLIPECSEIRGNSSDI